MLLSSLVVLATQCQPKGVDDPLPVVAEPVNAAWKELPPMHEPRYDGSAVTLLDGKVLVCGGKNFDGSGSMVGTELYDPATNTWEKLNTGERISVQAPELLRLRNGDVIAFDGSFDFGRANGTTSMVWRFTAATRQWKYVGQLGFLTGVPEQQRLTAGVELRDGRVVLAGSNKIAVLDGPTLRNYYTSGWGMAVYEGTIMWALPNNHFRALFTGRTAPNISYLAQEFDADLDGCTSFATLLRNDDLFTTGYGKNYLLKKK